MTSDASVGAMASFFYSLDVGEADFPELKRDQRYARTCGRVRMDMYTGMHAMLA